MTGSLVDRVLRAVGADSLREAATSDAYVAEGVGAIAAVVLSTEVASVALVEENGFEGSRPEVLKVLSKKGSAASAFWNVNGVVRFSCARRGKVVYSTELPDFEMDAVPRVLRKLLSAAEAEDADLAVIAVAMAVTYTGVELPHSDELSHPSRVHPIADPVLVLPVTAEELVGLQYPTRELVAAAQRASIEDCRRLTRWAALDALEATDMASHPVVVDIINQLDQLDRPAMLGHDFIDLRNEAARKLELIAGKRCAGTSAERHWAIQALLYTAVPDPVTAALGATHCATIRHGLGSDAASRFHQRALQVLG